MASLQTPDTATGLNRTLLFAEASIYAALTRGALRVAPLPRVLSLLAFIRTPAQRARVDVFSCLAAAHIAAARVAHPTCLYRSLIAFGMLARRGAPVVLHIGTTKAGEFGAHAWLSIEGRALDESEGSWADLWQRAPAPAPRR